VFSLSPRAAQALGMAFHELATNSLKYGALSVEGAKVDIGWELIPGDKLCLWWRESGGPPVTPPEHSGFGTMLIRDVPRSTLSADVKMEFEPAGLRWQIDGPIDAFSVQPAVSSA
jgi:two-component sensor histidine kinase